jgi:hypothetical protein
MLQVIKFIEDLTYDRPASKPNSESILLNR